MNASIQFDGVNGWGMVCRWAVIFSSQQSFILRLNEFFSHCFNQTL